MKPKLTLTAFVWAVCLLGLPPAASGPARRSLGEGGPHPRRVGLRALLAQSDFNWDPGWSRGWNRVPPRFPTPGAPHDPNFTFCRVLYQSVRREYLGHGWNTDYPDSDFNFMTRLSELTTTAIARDAAGKPNHLVVRLTDDALFEHPFIFMSDVGTAAFTDDEACRLREYLLRGGFLYVDDFWGDSAWEHWVNVIGRVLPASEYPVADIPLTDPVFDMFYRVNEIPQIPSIQFWRRSGRTSTSERGEESREPHLRGIRDKHGRLLVVMSHNTDIADGWEREGEDEEFFYRFSVKAYPVGVNIALYAMSH